MTQNEEKVTSSAEVKTSTMLASEPTLDASAQDETEYTQDVVQTLASPTETSLDDPDDAAGMALMEQSLQKVQRPVDYQVGDKIEGRVVSIDSQYVFFDIGNKSEASISKELLVGEGGTLPKVGEKVELFVVNVDGSNVELGRHLQGGDDTLATLEDAFHNGIPVEGMVRGRNKGGLEVEIFGKRAFCPISQIELRFCENPDVHLGKTYPFRITELKEKGRNIVVSRRAILEEENQQKAVLVREKVVVGAQLQGQVTSLAKYGAFVDLGAGVEGLVHVSEISHQRVQDPADVLKVGQQVRVSVLKVSSENERISLSMKALEEDPWEQSAREFQEGTTVKGRVVRLQAFGVFVELAPGVDGLIHVSELSHKRVNHPREVVKEGDEVEAKVISLDLEKRRIGLSLKELDTAGMPAPIEGSLVEGQTVEAIVDKIESFGVFVRLPGGARGLIPNSELNSSKNSDTTKLYPVEHRLQVVVSRIDENGRIRLSERAVHKQKEEAEYKDYIKSTKKQQDGPVFGTLGDLLKGLKK